MSAALTARHHPACYPSEPAAALAFFREAVEAFPARLVPPAPEGSFLPGIVAPHIDFRVSVAAHAAAFRPLLEVPLADTYVILGVGHRSKLEWNLDRRDYLTPLGTAVCASDLVDRLVEGAKAEAFFSPRAHEGEHSIEFPLVWLQALRELHPSGAGARPWRFVPLLCGGMHGYVEGWSKWGQRDEFYFLSRKLAELLKDDPDHRIHVIVSIDGCHLGPRFDHPFRVSSALLKATEGWEQKLWTVAARGDAEAFLAWFVEEGNDRYFDGVGALALLLAAGGGGLTIQRTFYDQWFTERDASAVTFSSGRVLRRTD